MSHPKYGLGWKSAYISDRRNAIFSPTTELKKIQAEGLSLKNLNYLII
jgi:hypothetical protein